MSLDLPGKHDRDGAHEGCDFLVEALGARSLFTRCEDSRPPSLRTIVYCPGQ
jgi:hypothetical protein